ncbi:MAG TPA: DUF91 domain-containing protein [Nitrospirae bacterium]|nr:DUF91 domain-containing protein [Nitrospirota bacterium]HDZ00302.1 DUF91 domain-containing protein [Nitrospirota bacterium]
MYKVGIANKQLIKIPTTTFSSLNLKERFDIQEWINKTPDILGEDLLIISKELILPSDKRLDLLAIDKQGALVIIELKRDDSGSNTEWQAIKYTSYCSNFTQDEIFEYFAEYLGSDADKAQATIEEFIDAEIKDINDTQRIILVSKEFHSEVAAAVLWLRDYGIDIECIRLSPHIDANQTLFINPEIIIPLPEAKDYYKKKETKQKEQRSTIRSSFSLEKSNLPENELKQKILQTLKRDSELTPRIIAFLEIITEENRAYTREEIKTSLSDAGIGKDAGQAGRYLSNISQFLTKKSNPHLRQVIEFDSGGTHGETKDNYKVLPAYRELLKTILDELSVIPSAKE